MFAAIYFGQVAFAALPLVVVEPPPEPVVEECGRFAVGRCIGVASQPATVSVGCCSVVPVRAIGTKSGPR